MAFCGEALAAASSEPLPLPGNHMQGQVNGLQGAGHHYPGGRKKRILKQYVNGGLGTSCTDSKATTREINGVRGRGAYFYNKVSRSVFIPPDIQIGKDAVVSPRWSFLSSSTRDVCNARQRCTRLLPPCSGTSSLGPRHTSPLPKEAYGPWGRLQFSIW